VAVAHIRLRRQPDLRRPLLVCAFRGWNDGGEAATTAAGYLRDRWSAERLGDVDPEEFFDFQVTRPSVRLEGGVTRRIEWPPNEFFHAALPERDVVLFIGIEPNVRWRTFSEAIVDAGRGLGMESVLTLGAFLADVPHTLPTPIAGSAPDAPQAAELGITASGYEGPTGIVGVLQDAATRAGFPAISLWAAVPHYLPTGPNPKAALALVNKAAAVAEVAVETDTLARAAAAWEEQVSETIEESPELQAYVERLEAGAGERQGTIEVPTGDALAAELEQFLRDQRGEGQT
jgi:predicted ATP-grasp superfamily ATP-dependent carboligase